MKPQVWQCIGMFWRLQMCCRMLLTWDKLWPGCTLLLIIACVAWSQAAVAFFIARAAQSSWILLEVFVDVDRLLFWSFPHELSSSIQTETNRSTQTDTNAKGHDLRVINFQLFICSEVLLVQSPWAKPHVWFPSLTLILRPNVVQRRLVASNLLLGLIRAKECLSGESLNRKDEQWSCFTYDR